MSGQSAPPHARQAPTTGHREADQTVGQRERERDGLLQPGPSHGVLREGNPWPRVAGLQDRPRSGRPADNHGAETGSDCRPDPETVRARYAASVSMVRGRAPSSLPSRPPLGVVVLAAEPDVAQVSEPVYGASFADHLRAHPASPRTPLRLTPAHRAFPPRRPCQGYALAPVFM